MATAGSIVIDILMKTGSFITDVVRAERSMRSLKKQALDFATVFQASFAGGVATGAVTEFVRQLSRIPGALNDLVASAGAFEDMAERIGVASDELAGFSIAAATADTSVEQLADFSTKLTKALSKTDDEADNTAKALRAIGLEFETFKRLDPIKQIEALSTALAGFGKGPERTAVLEGLVKGGSQLLPFLVALNEQGGRQNILTKEQIALADRFSDSQAKAAAQLKAYAQIAALEAVPAVLALSSSFVELFKELLNAGTASAKLNGDSAIKTWAESAARALAVFVDSLREVAADINVFVANSKREFSELILLNERVGVGISLAKNPIGFGIDVATGNDPFKGVKKALEDRNKAVADADQALLDRKNLDTKKFETLVKRELDAFRLTGARADAFQDPRSTTFGQTKPRIEVPNFGTGTPGKTEDTDKRLLENRLRDLDRAIKAEQDLLTQRNRALDGFNAISLQSFQAYYDAQIAIIEAGGSAQLAAIEKQIAAVNEARKKPGLKPADDAALEGKLQELQDKRAASQLETDRKIIEASDKKREAERRFQQQLDATRASVLELQGNLGEAAAIRFEQQNKDLRDRAAAERNTQLQSMLDTLKAATVAQAEFNKAQSDAERVTQSLAVIEERINISRQVGAINEFEALTRIGKARQAAIPQLRESVKAAEEALSKSPDNPQLIQNVERLRLELERLQAEADPLADKFRTIFEDAATTGIETFLDDVSKGKDAIKAFADTVIQQINRMVAQSASQAIFGEGGILGDFAKGASTIFGGGGGGGQTTAPAASAIGVAETTAKATADTAAATATTALATAATAATTGLAPLPLALPSAITGLAALTAAAEAAAAALLTISTSQATSTVADVGGAFFAEGGTPEVGKIAVGGERGIEAFFPRTRTATETSRAIERMAARGAQTISGAALIGTRGPQLFRPTVPGYVLPADETEELLRRFPDFGGAFASGGNPPLSRRSLGGEDGVEAFIPITSGRRLPEDTATDRGTRGGDTNITIAVQGTVDRRTRHQIANDIAREQRAAGRLA